MNMISKSLNAHPHTVGVWLNAWRFEKEEHPIVPLVASTVRELENNRGFLDQLGDRGRLFIRSLRAVAYGFSAKATVKVPGFAEVEASFVAKDMIDGGDKLRSDPLLDKSLHYQAFETLAHVHFNRDARIVVFHRRS
jgi:hypothetical protein